MHYQSYYSIQIQEKDPSIIPDFHYIFPFSNVS